MALPELVALQSQPEDVYRYDQEDDGPCKQFRQTLPGKVADEIGWDRPDQRRRDKSKQDQLGVVIEQGNRVNAERNDGVKHKAGQAGYHSHPERETLDYNQEGSENNRR